MQSPRSRWVSVVRERRDHRDPAVKELFKDRLTQVATRPEHTDLTIISGDKQYKISRLLATVHSTVIEQCLSGPWKESATNQILMNDDDPAAVALLVQFMNTLDYNDSVTVICDDDGYDLTEVAFVSPRAVSRLGAPSRLVQYLSTSFEIPELIIQLEHPPEYHDPDLVWDDIYFAEEAHERGEVHEADHNNEHTSAVPDVEEEDITMDIEPSADLENSDAELVAEIEGRRLRKEEKMRAEFIKAHNAQCSSWSTEFSTSLECDIAAYKIGHKYEMQGLMTLALSKFERLITSGRLSTAILASAAEAIFDEKFVPTGDQDVFEEHILAAILAKIYNNHNEAYFFSHIPAVVNTVHMAQRVMRTWPDHIDLLQCSGCKGRLGPNTFSRVCDIPCYEQCVRADMVRFWREDFLQRLDTLKWPKRQSPQEI